MQLRYPRFIHSEFMTHRAFSRNASSSRAIPVERMIADLRRDPAMPVYWGSNKPGMQAGAELTTMEIGACRLNWLNSMENAIHSASQLIELGLHKQIANRILEPWAHINVVVTATDWDNFFELRRHPDAQPEIHALADAMWDAAQKSIPEPLHSGEWHLPYADGPDIDLSTSQLVDEAIKISVARCARVSYLTHDGRPTTIDEDMKLYNQLVGASPLHASPAEHQATPFTDDDILNHCQKGNFSGWKQYRKILEMYHS
jgi:hypothetical protein